jgi:hypothetical protein
VGQAEGVTNKKASRGWWSGQMVECLSSKHETLSSKTPVPVKQGPAQDDQETKGAHVAGAQGMRGRDPQELYPTGL